MNSNRKDGQILESLHRLGSIAGREDYLADYSDFDKATSKDRDKYKLGGMDMAVYKFDFLQVNKKFGQISKPKNREFVMFWGESYETKEYFISVLLDGKVYSIEISSEGLVKKQALAILNAILDFLTGFSDYKSVKDILKRYRLTI